MKKIVTTLMIAGLAISFASCQKELDNAATTGPEDVVVLTLNATHEVGTKTILEGTTPKWSAGDKVTVMYKKTSQDTWTSAESGEAYSEDSYETATFSTTLTSPDESKNAYAFYPANNLSQDVADKAKITIASTQHPTGTSFDGGSDILISKPFNPSTSPVTTQFARLGAVLKIKINNATLASEKLVSLSVKGANPLAGDVLVGLSDKEVKSIENGSNTVTAEYAPANQFTVGSSNYVYLVVKPQTLANGSHLIISGQTENHTFTKDIELSQAINLNSGHIIPLNVTISSIKQLKVLAFDFTTAVAGWPTSSSNSAAGSYTYTLDEVDYTFTHTKTGNGIYQNSPAGQTPYLFMINGNYLGLPTVTNYRLAKVVFHNTTGGSNSAEIGITSRASGSVYLDDSAATQVMSTANTDYTFILSDSYKDKRYYIVAAGSKNAQAYSITLTFEESDRVFTPSALVMSDITCTAKTASSLTFSWDAVTGATGYKVSTDGGSSYGSLQAGTTYTWTGLSSFTEKTIYVKAIGDGEEYYDSAPKTAVGKTTLTVPTSITWTEGTKTVSWTDANSSAGEYNTVYKYIYTLDNGDSSNDASSSTTAALSIDVTKTVKVKAVCLTDANLNSDWSSGVACTIGGGEPEYEWVKVTSLSNLTDGEYVIINGSYYLPSTTTTSSPVATDAPTITDGKIADEDVTAAMKWTFTGTSSAMDITNSEGKYLCINTSGNTGLRVTTRSKEYSWVIAVNGTGFSMKYYDTAKTPVYRYCAVYATNSDWRTYNSATASNYEDGGKVYYYKKTVK